MNKYSISFIWVVVFVLSLPIEASLNSTPQTHSSTLSAQQNLIHPLEKGIKKDFETNQISKKVTEVQKKRYNGLFVQTMLYVKLYMHAINIKHPSVLLKRSLCSKDSETCSKIFKGIYETTPDFALLDPKHFTHADITNLIHIKNIAHESMEILTQHPLLLYNHTTLKKNLEKLITYFKNENVHTKLYAQNIHASLVYFYFDILCQVLLTCTSKKYIALCSNEKNLTEIISMIANMNIPNITTNENDLPTHINTFPIPLLEVNQNKYIFKQWVKDAYKTAYQQLDEETKKVYLHYDHAEYKPLISHDKHEMLFIPSTLDDSYTLHNPILDPISISTHITSTEPQTTPSPFLSKRKKKKKHNTTTSLKHMPETCSSTDTFAEQHSDADTENDNTTTISSTPFSFLSLQQSIHEVWYPRIQEWQYYEDKTNPLTCKALEKQGYFDGTNSFKTNLMHEYTKKYGNETEAARNIINNHLFPRSISLYIFNTMIPKKLSDNSYSFEIPAYRFNKQKNCYDYGFLEIGYSINSDKTQTYNVFHRFFKTSTFAEILKKIGVQPHKDYEATEDHQSMLAKHYTKKDISCNKEDELFQVVGETDENWKIDESDPLWTIFNHINPQKDMDTFSYGILKSSHLMK